LAGGCSWVAELAVKKLSIVALIVQVCSSVKIARPFQLFKHPLVCLDIVSFEKPFLHFFVIIQNCTRKLYRTREWATEPAI